jgi:[ribosomal protein S18]-alanine N-acetyltransferase
VRVPLARCVSRQTVIRSPKPEELELLLLIERRCFRSHRFTKKDFAYHFTNPHSIFGVAESDGEVVGYVAGVVYYGPANRIARLYSMAVLSKWRGQGVGAMLLTYFEREAIKHHCRWSILEVRKNNRSAKSLYARFGYKVVAVLKDYYAPGSDGLRMRKELRS